MCRACAHSRSHCRGTSTVPMTSSRRTLLRALAKIDSFEPGTNLPAWLFKILRNAFLTEYRKRRREVADSNGQHAQTLKTYPEQHSHVDFKELQQALGKLPASQREALILVGASG